MCNCVPRSWSWSPLSFSIINSTLNNSQISGTLFPITRSNGRLQLSDCSVKATPSPRSGSEREGYDQLEFEDKGDNELELRRRRSDASLKKISDEELEGEKGSGKNGDEFVKMESRRRQVMKRSNMVAKQVISIQSAQSLGFVSQLWVDTTSVSTLLFILLFILIQSKSCYFVTAQCPFATEFRSFGVHCISMTCFILGGSYFFLFTFRFQKYKARNFIG